MDQDKNDANVRRNLIKTYKAVPAMDIFVEAEVERSDFVELDEAYRTERKRKETEEGTEIQAKFVKTRPPPVKVRPAAPQPGGTAPASSVPDPALTSSIPAVTVAVTSSGPGSRGFIVPRAGPLVVPRGRGGGGPTRGGPTRGRAPSQHSSRSQTANVEDDNNDEENPGGSYGFDGTFDDSDSQDAL